VEDSASSPVAVERRCRDPFATVEDR